MDFQQMATWWTTQADGKETFYKLPEHLELHFKKIVENQDQTATIALHENVLASSTACINSAMHQSKVLPPMTRQSLIALATDANQFSSESQRQPRLQPPIQSLVPHSQMSQQLQHRMPSTFPPPPHMPWMSQSPPFASQMPWAGPPSNFNFGSFHSHSLSMLPNFQYTLPPQISQPAHLQLSGNQLPVFPPTLIGDGHQTINQKSQRAGHRCCKVCINAG